ncbi:MAG: RNA-binding domain-containing protein [Nitrososphaerales archaeon]
MKFSSIEITWLVHATENGDRIIKNLVELFPLSKDSIESYDLKGHFGNPILFHRARLTNDEADKFVYSLFSSLSDVDKKVLDLELSKYLDEHGALYIRINKQSLCEGKVGMSEVDAIRIRLKPRSGLKFHEKLQYYRGLLR